MLDKIDQKSGTSEVKLKFIMKKLGFFEDIFWATCMKRNFFLAKLSIETTMLACFTVSCSEGVVRDLFSNSAASNDFFK